MKKTFAILSLCTLLAAPILAQKKVVKQVERIVESDKPDLAQARELIKPTLESAETAQDPKAWFVAAEVERKAADMEKFKMALKKEANEEVMYNAMEQMYPYYMEAYRLDGMPNSRGKVKRQHEKEIKKALEDYHGFYVNGGSYYLNKGDNAKAYKFFKIFSDLKRHPMFEDSDLAKPDSMSMQIDFYRAYTSTLVNEPEVCIPEIEAIKDCPYRQSDIYQLLAGQYMKAQDTVNFKNTLMEGAKLFPDSKFFLFNLINQYINEKKNDEALTYLNKALEADPNNVSLINVKGKVYEQGFQDSEKAKECFLKALEIDPTHAESTIDLGRIYYNQAIAIQSESNNLDINSPKAKELNTKAKDLFKKALPYFEKAVELKPDSKEYMMALRGIYYNLGEDAKVEELSKKLGIE